MPKIVSIEQHLFVLYSLQWKISLNTACLYHKSIVKNKFLKSDVVFYLFILIRPIFNVKY